MDKITHQVRAEHWAKIMNECINSGMSKTDLVQSKWDFSEAVLLLAEDPAQGSFRKFPEFIITGNCRTASGNGADGASDSKGSLFY